jgi:tartrate-resistant acid phosphatase type 5
MVKRVSFALLVAIFSLTAALGFYFYTHPLILRIPSNPEAVDNITFYALGDQGDGGVDQWEVARAMEKQAEKYGKVDFVTLLGDNFYSEQPLTLDSPEWQSKFENVYDGKYLSATPFYAVLGNHDPETVDGRNVEIEYSRRQMGSNRWRMPALYYVSDFGKVDGRPLVRIVFLDTNLPLEALKTEADFLRHSFASGEDGPIWKIVVGHHPVRSFGKHFAENTARSAIIAAALEDAHVDLYLAGHDHNQQLIANGSDPVYVINGGGGAHTYALREKSPDLLFSREGHGFVGVHADKQTLAIDIFDATPRTLASYTIARACAAAPSQCLKAVRR